MSAWNGAINVSVHYESHNYLLTIYRNQYFPQFFSSITQYFHECCDLSTTAPIWLEYGNTPIQWNLPAGLLFDLFCVAYSHNRSHWKLRLKSGTPYPETLIPFTQTEGKPDYLKELRLVITNHLKQACYVMNGSSRAMMNLSESDSELLWSSVLNHDYTSYQQINNKVLPKKWKNRIPIKIYVANSKIQIQSPVSAQDCPTLGAFLRTWVPELNCRAIIQGIDADVLYNTPLLDIWEKLHHLDDFLYVVVAPC